MTAMHYHLHGVVDRNNIDKITIYYDPNSPMERVGQGATIPVAHLLTNFFAADWYNQKELFNAVRKDGILYENWGKKQEKLFHSFGLMGASLHYVPEMLSKQILSCGVFDVVEKKIDDPEKEIDSDFIFDCRGRHKRNPELYEPLINPINAVFLGKTDKFDPSLTYTRTIATPDGWTFGIPTNDGVNYGYLFNKNITPKEKAKENMIELFGVKPHTHLTFENYIAKEFFYGERTFFNGNRLGFLEPLEATSTNFHLYAARCAYEHIEAGCSKKDANLYLRKEMKRIETFILWHYQKGSKYDTPFWEYAKSLPFIVDDEFIEYRDMSANKDHFEMFKLNMSYPPYSQWSIMSFNIWEANT